VSFTLHHGDCLEVMAGMDAGSVDAVVTDPPYGTGGWRRQSTGNGSDPSGSLVMEAWDDGAVEWLALAGGIAEAVFVFWPAARTLPLLNAALSVGLTKHRCLYMRKLDPKPMVGGRTRWSVEPIWVLSRDGFVLTGGDDVFSASTPRMGRDSDANPHPYQKPLSVMKWLLSKLPPSWSVLDPFMGSGTTGVACAEEGREFVGIEREAEYIEIARRRIEAASAQERLPV
jgi:site-specific DNA-methyltransferase (adenine-specific)